MLDDNPTPPAPAALRHQSAFTLVELLLVVAAIGVLAVLTTLGARRLTQGTRLASATNSVINVLGAARAAAIRDHEVTAVVFRAVWDPSKAYVPQRVEISIVRSTYDRYIFSPDSESDARSMSERFRPVDREPVILLPEGIKVAGPLHDFGTGTFPANLQCPGTSYRYDEIYATQAELPKVLNCVEPREFGRIIAVMFGPDGQFLTRPQKSSLGDMKSYVDWNNDGEAALPSIDPQTVEHPGGNNCGEGNFEKYWLHDDFRDEPNMMLVPTLSVYDDRAAREAAGTLEDECDFIAKIVGPGGYIAQFGERISFNRFSGLPERKGR